MQVFGEILQVSVVCIKACIRSKDDTITNQFTQLTQQATAED